jgi:hypothetical protein
VKQQTGENVEFLVEAMHNILQAFASKQTKAKILESPGSSSSSSSYQHSDG